MQAREGYAATAAVSMDDAAQTDVLGAAITLALCGSWDHAPPCPHAPHHTSTQAADGRVHVRVLFAVAPEQAEGVTSAIHSALASGRLEHEGDLLGTWELLDFTTDAVTAAEQAHVAALVAS